MQAILSSIKTKSIAPPVLFVFFWVVIFLSAPVSNRQFGYLNDYSTFEYNNQTCCLGFPETTQVIAIGRPLQAVLLNIQLFFVKDINSFELLRLISSFLIGMAASLFYLYTRRILIISQLSAALLAILTFTLPSMVINSFWVAQSIAGIFPLFLVIGAHSLLGKVDVTQKLRSGIINMIGVVILLILSFCIYQPTTFFFFTLTVLKLIFGTQESRKESYRRVGLEIFLLFLSSLIYLFIVKYGIKPILIKDNPWGLEFRELYEQMDVTNSAYSFSIFNSDLKAKISRISDLFSLILSSWFPIFPHKLFLILAPLYLGTSSYVLMKSPFGGKIESLYVRFIIGIAISIALPCIAAAPVLVAQANYPVLYRVTFASMAIIPAVAIFYLERVLQRGVEWKGYFPFLLIFALLIISAEVSSYYRLSFMASRLEGEYLHVTNWVKNEISDNSHELLIPPFHEPSDPHNFLPLDFGYTAVNSITLGMVNAVARTNRFDIDNYKVIYDPLGPRYRSAISNGINFSRDGYPSFIKAYKGISGREDFGRWTDSEEAAIEFVEPLPKHFQLKLLTGASAEVIEKPIAIIIGGYQSKLILDKEKSSELTFDVLTDGNANSILFRLPPIRSPHDLGLSTDKRQLGLAFIRLQIYPMPVK